MGFVFCVTPIATDFFWSSFVWVLFALCLSLDTRVQERLHKIPVAVWISGFALSRRFGLAYLIQYVYAFSLARLLDAVGSNTPLAADLSLISIFPATELLTRLCDRWIHKVRTQA